jgi:hypothetical protein
MLSFKHKDLKQSKKDMIKTASAYGYPMMMDALLQQAEELDGMREKLMEILMRASIDCNVLFAKYRYGDQEPKWQCGVVGLAGGGEDKQTTIDAVDRWIATAGPKHVARADHGEAAAVVLAGGGHPQHLMTPPDDRMVRGAQYSAWMARAGLRRDYVPSGHPTEFDGHSWLRHTIYCGGPTDSLPFRLLTLSGN